MLKYIIFLFLLILNLNNSFKTNNLQKIQKQIALISIISSSFITSLPSQSLANSPNISPIGNIPAAINAVTNDIQSITCTLDNQNADDFHGSCQQLDNIVRIRANRLFTIKQEWGSSASTGAAVWNGANMGVWYMENSIEPSSGSSNSNGNNNVWKDAKVIELGGGIGFSSLIANALGATDVTITDGNNDVLKLAQKNIEINVPQHKRSQIRTAQLRWGTDDENNFISNNNNKDVNNINSNSNSNSNSGGSSNGNVKAPDFILVSDCTYKKAAWPDLIGTIYRLSDTHTRTILSMEPRNIGEVEGVIAEAKKQGLVVEEKQIPVDPIKSQCSLLCARLFEIKRI